MATGKFLVLEGLDGAGSSTHARLLKKWFKKKRIKFLALRYPDYSDKIGKTIHAFLYGKIKLPREIVFLLYALNQLKDKEKIQKALKRGKIVLTDRYFTSNLAYQCNQEVRVKSALQFAKLFSFPIPDLIIYLDVKPQTALKRKKKERKHALDIYEKDLAKMRKVSKRYKELIKRRIFAKWISVNSEGTVQEVFDRIIKVLKSKVI